jgi:tetratricopeptide (TPR) repeat protein
MPARGLVVVTLSLFVTLVSLDGFAARQPQGLTAPSAVRDAYDVILDARFDEVPQRLRLTCGPVPAEACLVLDSVASWWRIRLDPFNDTRDAVFEQKNEKALAATRRWTRAQPNRAEAWFYLGGAYGARAQWRALRGARVSAARDGRRAKDALERALAIDPSIADAHFGIGLYRYYAAVAPSTARLLQWLLLMPGGDRLQGLDEINRARTAGLVLRDEADYQLHLISLWYERRPERALALLGDLAARHPRNPHFPQAIAEIHDTYLHDARASLHWWQRLLDMAHAGDVEQPRLAATAARLGISLQLDRLSRSAEAIEPLRAIIAENSAEPYAAVARAHLLLGDVLTHLDRRDEALASYQAAIAAVDADDALRIASRARAAMRARP